MTLKNDVASFIQTNLVGEDRKLTIAENTELIEEGIIDSMGLMQIVAFLEERAGVRVPDDEVTPDNFATVSAIDELVERLKARRG